MNAKPAKKQCRNQSLPILERPIATIAHIAMIDTILGGASAMMLANRADSIGKNSKDRFQYPSFEEVVGDVYSRSTGRVSNTYGAWECNECGQTYLGRENAELCCQMDEDDYIEDEDEE